MVYQPKRSVKLKDIQLNNLVKQTRYKAHWVSEVPLRKQVERDQSTLKR
jgi:hypothetical protein